MNKRFILNIGHKTRAGGTLTQEAIARELAMRSVTPGQWREVVAAYEEIPEVTSVIHCEIDDGDRSSKTFSFLSTALDQECIAVVEFGGANLDGAALASGKLYGANPKGYAFDWAQFRI